MYTSTSENYLHHLAERTFLKLWAIPNPFRSAGKEISDLIVVFGDDVIIFSDKACSSDFGDNPTLAWSRWRRAAIEGSVKQLAGAIRRLSNTSTAVFLDSKAREPLPYGRPDPAKSRYHLVGIAHPDLDPNVVPRGWQGLTYVDLPSHLPFRIEPLFVGQTFVHVFDGPTIDLLLKHLDTAPDFIGYLTARAESLHKGCSYAFVEPDFLAAAALNWMDGKGLTVAPLALARIKAGLWDEYVRSQRAERSKEMNARSRTIDNLIEHFHNEYVGNRLLNTPRPGFASHEQALRLLAAESRFARRIIVTELYDILEEDVGTCFCASTVSSPTTTGLRYVWLTYPDPPSDWSRERFEQLLDQHLARHIWVACAIFPETLIVGIALPNLAATETAHVIKVFDGSGWTEADRLEALKLQGQGIFAELRAQTRIHYP
jgi:hypothetical protein